MIIIGSIYYQLAKEVLLDYRDEPRSTSYKLGNWLTVPEEHIV